MSVVPPEAGSREEREFLAVCGQARKNSNWAPVRQALALASLVENEFLVFRIYAWAMLEASHSGRPLLLQWVVASAWLSGHNLALEFCRRAESLYLGFIGNKDDRVFEMRELCDQYEKKILSSRKIP